MSLTIRVAVPDDAAAACNVLRRAISECCVQDHQHQPALLDAWLGNKTPDNVASWFQTPSNYCQVAVVDGAVVGVSLMTQAGKISLCYLLPEWHGKGIGKAMLEGMEAQARRWGVSVMRLNSTLTARDFYAHHGYIYGGKERACYGLECDFFWKKLGEQAEDQAQDQSRKRFCPCGDATPPRL